MLDWKGMLQELLADESDTMSTWEVEFIESLDKQRRAEEWTPSDKQFVVLEKIWQKVFL
jgi:hypothetical protein